MDTPDNRNPRQDTNITSYFAEKLPLALRILEMFHLCFYIRHSHRYCFI